MEATPIYERVKELSRQEAEVARIKGMDETKKKVQFFIGRKYKETKNRNIRSVLRELAQELELVK